MTKLKLAVSPTFAPRALNMSAARGWKPVRRPHAHTLGAESDHIAKATAMNTGARRSRRLPFLTSVTSPLDSRLEYDEESGFNLKERRVAAIDRPTWVSRFAPNGGLTCER